MKWLIVLVVALAAVRATDELLTYPEIARGSSRILSGWEAVEGQIPHQLSLRMISGVGAVFACGASVVHPEWAITAAHCTANRPTIVIRFGTVNLTSPALLVESTVFYNHPLYDESISGIVQPHDIGVIKFPFAVEFNKSYGIATYRLNWSSPTGETPPPYRRPQPNNNQFGVVGFLHRIQPIRVQRSADKDANYDGVRLTASGWGALWTNSASPENMNWVFLRGVTNDFCWRAFGLSPIIVASTICASGYNVTTQSTCQGDSGGPLTAIEEDGKLTLVGVTSFVSGQGCHVDIPAGFIRPGHYHDWFTEVTGVNFDWDWAETPTTTEAATTEATEGTTVEATDATTTTEAATTEATEGTTAEATDATTTTEAATTEATEGTTAEATDATTTTEAATEKTSTEAATEGTTTEAATLTTPESDSEGFFARMRNLFN